MIDIQKQEDLRKFVDEEVHACQSTLAEKALGKGLFSWDDVDNIYRPFDIRNVDNGTCKDCVLISTELDLETEKCRGCYDKDQDMQEIYEWWVVSEWLAILLYKHGAPLLKNKYGTWWGRCATGQAIFLDSIINNIYDEVMKI